MEKKFLSRAGYKLEFAINHFGLNVEGKLCADFGSNVGGFVDCMWQRGATKIYSVDTSYGTLAWVLRQNPAIVVMERSNAMHVSLAEQVDFISIDVGWTRQDKILPNALTNLKDTGDIISLLKPHYEAEKLELDSGTVKAEYLDVVLQRCLKRIESCEGLIVKGLVQSPIVGGKGGNTEYLVHLQTG